jgi:hypothetical protein
MKTTIVLALAAAGLALPATAQQTPTPKPKAEVVQRDAKGRATVVKVDGVEYKVCTADAQDSCINPREAGLDFGSVPIDHWPGKPASEGGQ